MIAGEFSIFKLLKLADLLTILNGVLGFLGLVVFLDHPQWGMLLVLAAIGCDYLDGHVARWMGEANVLGKELDSLSDVISFGVVPSLMIFYTFPGVLSAVTGAIWVAAGIIRLARFNVIKYPGFIGVPITFSALAILGLLWVFPQSMIINISQLILSWLMISNLKLKKI